MWLRVYCFIPRTISTQYLDIYTISRYLDISAAALLGIEIQEVMFPGFPPAPRLPAVRWE